MSADVENGRPVLPTLPRESTGLTRPILPVRPVLSVRPILSTLNRGQVQPYPITASIARIEAARDAMSHNEYQALLAAITQGEQS